MFREQMEKMLYLEASGLEGNCAFGFYKIERRRFIQF